jgi:hypothetical protein
MKIFAADWKKGEGELRLDDAYQSTLPEFYRRRDALGPDDLPQAFSKLYI